MGRETRITSEIKRQDAKLYCKRNTEGKLCIFRDGHSWESHSLEDGSSLKVLRPTPYFVCALTHNWKLQGIAVDWGIEPVLARLRAMDLWERDLVSEIIRNEEKHELAMDRQRKNATEDFLLEFRNDFKKTFKDVNTSSMEKIDPRRKREKYAKQ